MTSESMVRGLKQARPFILVILLQFGSAGMNIIIKFALNEGMNQHVLVVYRHIFATLAIAPFALILERKTRPKMTYSIFTKIFLLALLEPVIDQNLFFTGMKYTTATFGAAMGNILPAFVFIMAWIIGLEKVNICRIHSQSKMFGTVVTLGGAMLMTIFKGPALGFPWTRQSIDHVPSSPESSQISGKGAAMIGAGCVCWASFIILQTITLKTYPCELSLTALICVMGASQGSVVALALEWGNTAAWAVHVDATLFAYLYTGIVSSGIGYYVQGLVIKDKGPVFVTAFNPLCMIIVALLSSFILSEMMYMGRIIGGVVIIFGLYMVLWGKSGDESSSESSKKVLAPDTVTTNKIELIPVDGNKGRVGEEYV